MADILPFRRPDKPDSTSRPAGGDTLCRNGHHRWLVCKNKQFDVKRGRLITVYRCQRCGKERVEAH